MSSLSSSDVNVVEEVRASFSFSPCGGRVILTLPKQTEFIDACDFYVAVNSFLSTVTLGSGASVPRRSVSEFVTHKDVSEEWNIGGSTFRLKVREGTFPQPVERGENGKPTLWLRSDVERVLIENGYERRNSL